MITCSFVVMVAEPEAAFTLLNTLQEKPDSSSIPVDTGNENISCTLTPFTLPMIKELFGIKSNADIETFSDKKINFYFRYLPIKVTIKNKSKQNILLSTEQVHNQQYIHFNTYEVAPTAKVLEYFDSNLSPLKHMAYGSGILATGGIGLSLLRFSYMVLTEPAGRGECAMLANAFALLSGTLSGLIGVSSTGTAFYLTQKYWKTLKSPAYNKLKMVLSTLNPPYKPIPESLIIGEEYVALKAGTNKNDIIFIDTEKYPDILHELTNQSATATNTKLLYQLE